MIDPATVIEATRQWIFNTVIGLNLCPFAQRVFNGEKIRYVVSEASDDESLLADLVKELNLLLETPVEEIETTLLIHPQVFQDFLDFNDFLGLLEPLLEDLQLEGIIQIASFHPQYQFAGTQPDAAENGTNRSPYPMLHLLREDSITALGMSEEELMEIPLRNIATMKHRGLK